MQQIYKKAFGPWTFGCLSVFFYSGLTGVIIPSLKFLSSALEWIILHRTGKIDIDNSKTGIMRSGLSGRFFCIHVRSLGGWGGA